MAPTQPSSNQPDPRTLGVIYRLAAFDRGPASDGEQAAAELLAGELTVRGARAHLERERVHGTYWVPIGMCSAAAALAGLAGRRVATAIGVATALTLADDLDVGRRPLRRVLRQRFAHNVVAEVAPAHPNGRTVVVHAHHDAARTGAVFHPAIAKLAACLVGPLIDRWGATPAPMWGAVHGAAAVGAGGLVGSRRLRRAGAVVSAGYAAAMANIAHSRTVPGANDNLSGVAVLLELAEALGRRPPASVRVLLLSTGAEESFLEAMVRFGERHFAALAREKTTFVTLESVGSPTLMLLAGEGLFRLRRYPPDVIKTMSDLARAHGIRLHEPFRYRLATDGQVPLLAGYPVAVISSMDWYRAPSNYHWPTDQPDNLDTGTLGAATALAEAFVRELDREPSGDRR
jgi:hypothetical protein